MARSRQKKAALLGPAWDEAQEVTPKLAHRTTPDYVRFSTFPIHADETGQAVLFNRKAIESRKMEAAPDQGRGYSLWMVQHFDFMDGQGPVNFIDRSTLLPNRHLSYDDVITAMSSAMKAWRDEGFAHEITHPAPSPEAT